MKKKQNIFTSSIIGIFLEQSNIQHEIQQNTKKINYGFL